MKLLREYNRQREKTNDERLREELIDVNPDLAHHSLRDYRQKKSEVEIKTISLRAKRNRCNISDAKRPFLEAVKEIIFARRKYWPLSERRVHYKLVELPVRPLRNADLPEQYWCKQAKPSRWISNRYENDRRSSQDLSDLITRARLIGEIPFEAIGDETRPRTNWTMYENPREFMRSELEGLFRGYWRNLQSSQPNYIHIFGEKNTVYPVLKPAGMDFCINVTSGRGFSSHDPIHEIAECYHNSGKEKLILLVLNQA